MFFDTLGCKVLALDLRSGSVRWQMQVDNVAMSTPIVADGNVYIGTGHNGTIGSHNSNFVYAAGENGSTLQMWGRPEGDHVLACDVKTGEKRWTYRTAGENMPLPGAINGMLIFVNGGFNAYGLRTRDGSAAWQRGLRGLATMASANRAGEYAIVSTCSGSEYRGETMALHWRPGTSPGARQRVTATRLRPCRVAACSSAESTGTGSRTDTGLVAQSMRSMPAVGAFCGAMFLRRPARTRRSDRTNVRLRAATIAARIFRRFPRSTSLSPSTRLPVGYDGRSARRVP